MRAVLAVCIGCAFLLGAVSAQTKYSLKANGTCGNSYFDTTSYECLPCGMTGAVATGPLCGCASGFAASSSDSSCLPCPTGYSNSFTDPRTCLSCNVSSFAFGAVNGIYNNATYDPITKTCFCPAGMYLTEYTRVGAGAQLVDSFSCISCPDNYATSADRRSCVPCKDPLMRRSAAGLCSCAAAGYTDDGFGNCVTLAALTAVSAKYSQAAVGKLTFYNVMNSDGTTRDSVPVLMSSLFVSLFPSAASGCSRLSASVKGNLDPSPCQALANLCMLAQFDSSHPSCLALKEYSAGAQGLTNGFRDWGARFPWIQYTEAAGTVLTSDQITVPVSFRGYNSTLNFTLATFATNGRFIGLSKLSDQLHMCAGQQSELTKFLQVGYSQDVTCSISMPAITSKDGFAYELFVNDVNGLMYPVPVVVSTLRAGTAQPNQLFYQEGSQTSTVLTRRFFLADTQSGRSSDSKQSVVQYASKVVLRISTRPTSPISIYPPVLIITYSSYSDSQTDFPAAFSSEYTMDTLAFSDLQRSVLVIIVGVVIAAHSILKTFNIMRIHQNQALTGKEYLNVLGSICGCISDWLFLWIFLVCLYLFIFFKTQLEAHVLMPLPSSSLQKSLVQCINVAGSLKVFQVAFVIYRSINMDIFFIDWEKPSVPVKADGDIPDVSTWRSLFATNEWNELLSYRRCSLEFTLILIMWLFSGQNWINVTASRPNQFDLSPGAPSAPLEFFFVLLLFYASSLCQYFFRVFIRERFISDPISQYVSLLSLANISVLVLIDRFYGYYIHGRSVHNRADCNVLEIANQIKQEENGLAPKRGLSASSEQQVFEIYLPQTVRGEYDKIFATENEQESSKRALSIGKLQLGSEEGKKNQSVMTASERLLRAKIALSQYLQTVVDKLQLNMQTAVQEKQMLHGVLGLHPEVNGITDCRLCPNTDGFISAFPVGSERDIVCFEALLLVMLAIGTQNILLACFLTYIISGAFLLVWRELYQANLSTKALVDDRFLL